MSFNKTKFNRQRFNKSSDITVYIQGFIAGTGHIIADVVVNDVIIIQVALVGSGDIRSDLKADRRVATSFTGYANLLAGAIRIADFTASLKGSGNIVSDIQLLKNIRTLLETKGGITSKLTAVLNVDGQFQADNDIYSYLTKVSQVLAELTASGLIESDTVIIINLSDQFGGGADLIIADPYIQYKLSYITLPTRALIRDTKTKAILVD